MTSRSEINADGKSIFDASNMVASPSGSFALLGKRSRGREKTSQKIHIQFACHPFEWPYYREGNTQNPFVQSRGGCRVEIMTSGRHFEICIVRFTIRIHRYEAKRSCE